MADLSNKALAVLLVAAIVVSVSGTLVSLDKFAARSPTGLVTSNDTSGVTDFTITQNFSITFVQNAIHFGSGSVLGGPCTMGTNNSNPQDDPGSNCNGFNQTVASSNLTIENDGNIPANVSLNFSDTASGFIGGTSPSFQYDVRNTSTRGGCDQIQNTSSGFKEVGATETAVSGARVCRFLDYQDASDRIQVGIWLNVPEDAPIRANTVSITAIGCDDSSC